ncbi:WhiB family transcriptional regulator [Mycobacterium sp. TY814]|uniref:WhiB family transcriptional regulator n=1 Tax=unclassified Mycobacterium TaxID=2642494 RepID=UPI0035326B02
MIADGSWPEDAACRGTANPEWWFPEQGGSCRAAKRVCFTCTVQQACLDHALTHDEGFGIWGGFGEKERRGLKAGQPIGDRRLLCRQGHDLLIVGTTPSNECKQCQRDAQKRWRSKRHHRRAS